MTRQRNDPGSTFLLSNSRIISKLPGISQSSSFLY